MASIKKIYNNCAEQYDNHPYCSRESLGSVMEFAVQKYLFRKYGIDLKGKYVIDIMKLY